MDGYWCSEMDEQVEVGGRRGLGKLWGEEWTRTAGSKEDERRQAAYGAKWPRTMTTSKG